MTHNKIDVTEEMIIAGIHEVHSIALRGFTLETMVERIYTKMEEARREAFQEAACAPPAGTPEGTHHVLRNGADVALLLWKRGQYFDNCTGRRPQDLYSCGWRYAGPAPELPVDTGGR